MALVEKIKDIANKVLPQRKQPGIPILGTSSSGGIGHGIASFDDEMPLSKPAIVYYTCQIFFSFLALCCFASVASFQARWKIGPSGLTGFSIFIAITGMLLSAVLLLVPVIYDKYNKLTRVARALSEVRVHFILSGAGLLWLLLAAFMTTISAFTQPGCKNANNDPNSKALGAEFRTQLPGWCSTKKAGSIFFWLAFLSWLATFVVAVLDWRNGTATTRPRPKDTPFNPPPTVPSYGDDDDSTYAPPYSRPGQQPHDDGYDEPHSPFNDQPPNRYGTPGLGRPSVDTYGAFSDHPAPGRPSVDTYGAFSDPPPSGYDAPPPVEGVSRTMQYADPQFATPYDRVRANIGATR